VLTRYLVWRRNRTPTAEVSTPGLSENTADPRRTRSSQGLTRKLAGRAVSANTDGFSTVKSADWSSLAT